MNDCRIYKKPSESEADESSAWMLCAVTCGWMLFRQSDNKDSSTFGLIFWAQENLQMKRTECQVGAQFSPDSAEPVRLAKLKQLAIRSTGLPRVAGYDTCKGLSFVTHDGKQDKEACGFCFRHCASHPAPFPLHFVGVFAE